MSKVIEKLKANFSLRGKIKKDRRTKNLVKRLRPGDIALISHRDLDWVAAEGLLRCGVKGILNTEIFSTGLLPPGPLRLLLEKGICLIESLPDSLFNLLAEGERVAIINGSVIYRGQEAARGRVITAADYQGQYSEAHCSSPQVVEDFVVNTLNYAYRERSLITSIFSYPSLNTNFCNRDVVIVIRGKGYREDLKAIRVFIREKKPVLIGVDGGGDALLEYGFRPDVIIGDMDSVSDTALLKSKEVVVHAYHDGRGVPGQQRLEDLGLPFKLLSAPGTSEDIAMLMSYELGAALIVAIGAHSSVIEFLEKGRRGMSSTFLVRLKVGDRLVDAKGVSRLYSSRAVPYFLPVIIAAGLMPLLVMAALSPLIQHLFRLLMFRLQLGR